MSPCILGISKLPELTLQHVPLRYPLKLYANGQNGDAMEKDKFERTDELCKNGPAGQDASPLERRMQEQRNDKTQRKICEYSLKRSARIVQHGDGKEYVPSAASLRLGTLILILIGSVAAGCRLMPS